MTARRFDSVAIDLASVTRTPSGGLRIPAVITRTGVFEYKTPSGKVIREYRSPEEVFNADSMASAQGAVVTDLHPPTKVDPSNWKTLAKGHLVEGSVKPETTLLLSVLAVEDLRTIQKIDSGELAEISCGYDCAFDDTSGVTPDGQPYDRSQKKIVYNHIALGPIGWGRAGPDVALRLDSAGNMIPGCAEQPTTIGRKRMASVKITKRGLRINGVEFDTRTKAGCAQARAAVSSFLSSEYRTDDKAGDVKTAYEALGLALKDLMESAVDTAEEKADEESEKKPDADKKDEAPTNSAGDEKKPDADKKDGDEEPDGDEATKDEDSEKRMDAAASFLADVRAKATALIPGINVKGKNAKTLIRETVKAFGKKHAKDYATRVDSMSDARVTGLFEGLEAPKSGGTFDTLRGGNKETRTDAAEMTAKQKYDAHLNSAHKGK